MRSAALVSLVLCLGLASCGGSDGGSGGDEPASEEAACERVYGDVLNEMRSLMAEIDAGMTVGEFREEYPKLAGPLQLAKDEARGSECPVQIGSKIDRMYKRIRRDGEDPSTIKKWNEDYEALRDEIAALP